MLKTTVKSINKHDRVEADDPRRDTDGHKERTAIFAGSFNPFTVGHASLVERGLNIFDRLVIVVGVNAEKPAEEAESRALTIRKLYNKEPRVSVIVWNGLMVDLAKREGVRFFLRGIRNSNDFVYEQSMADINRRVGHIETVFLPSLPEHQSISSSVVRELQSYGVDVDDMLPKK